MDTGLIKNSLLLINYLDLIKIKLINFALWKIFNFYHQNLTLLKTNGFVLMELIDSISLWFIYHFIKE